LNHLVRNIASPVVRCRFGLDIENGIDRRVPVRPGWRPLEGMENPTRKLQKQSTAVDVDRAVCGSLRSGCLNG